MNKFELTKILSCTYLAYFHSDLTRLNQRISSSVISDQGDMTHPAKHNSVAVKFDNILIATWGLSRFHTYLVCNQWSSTFCFLAKQQFSANCNESIHDNINLNCEVEQQNFKNLVQEFCLKKRKRRESRNRRTISKVLPLGGEESEEEDCFCFLVC